MFADRYFTTRMFADRYFAKSGSADATAPDLPGLSWVATGKLEWSAPPERLDYSATGKVHWSAPDED